MEARGQVADANDDDCLDTVNEPAAARTSLPEPMQTEDSAVSAAASGAASVEVTGTEFEDPVSMLEATDPLAAHMDALRRQLGGNFRDLTNHSDQPNLEKYVEAEEDESIKHTSSHREDPREFYARVMAHQRAMEEEESSRGEHDAIARDETTARLLSSVPPVTPEQAAMLAAQYASIDASTSPAPDDKCFEAAPPKADQQVWVKDMPDRTPVRDEGESDDEDVALLKEMAALSIERSPATRALDQAESDLAEAADSVARGDTMAAEHTAEDGSIVEDNDLALLSSLVDSEVADIAGTMLSADDAVSSTSSAHKVNSEVESDLEDPIATLLSIAAETAAEPSLDSPTLEESGNDLTTVGVPAGSMGGGAGLDSVDLPLEQQSEQQVVVPSPSSGTPALTDGLMDEMHMG